MSKTSSKNEISLELFESFDTIKPTDYFIGKGGFIVLKIGDFSKIAKVSIKTLRHYDQLGLLVPEEVDYFTGYRKYSVYQLNRLYRILFYKDLGFSLKEISEIIEQEISVEQMTKLLEQRKKQLESSIEEAKRNLDLVQGRIMQMKIDQSIPVYDIQVTEPKKFTVVSVRTIIPKVEEFTFYSNQSYNYIYDVLDKIHIEPSGYEFNLYHLTEYTEENLDIEFCVSVEVTDKQHMVIEKTDLVYREIQDEHLTAVLMFTGDYCDLSVPIIEMLKWLENSGYELDGEMREIHLSGKAHVDNVLQKDAAVELQMPIKKIETR